MAVLLYATSDDLLEDEWVEALPPRPKSLIRHASLLVDHACTFDRYDTDDTGMPTDPKVLAAFRDAVCQQIAVWDAGRVDPVAGGVGQSPQIASQSTEGDSVSYGNLPSVQDVERVSNSLCGAALKLLRAEGLASNVPGML